MVDVAFLRPLFGGALIGLSASLLLLTHGRVAGVSGMYSGLVDRSGVDRGFRVWFLAGLIGAGAISLAFAGDTRLTSSSLSLPVAAIAGLLVGFGTKLGGGCTSGHGVCGVSRLSPRSLVATLIFMAVAALTVFIARHVAGGSL